MYMCMYVYVYVWNLIYLCAYSLGRDSTTCCTTFFTNFMCFVFVVCQVSAFMDGPCVAGNYVQSIRYITQSGVNCPALLQTLVYRASCQQPLSGNDDEGDRTGTMSYMCLGGCTTSTTDMTTIDNNVTF
eukprot:TRINITY_DN5066_c0_g1_i3.p1 TRINITY_DN5066_c0_g1~~TRINITY_DN5066_c0_g1_i3.p1  ORF type:complete len:129 (+),score=15.79 TRINITY_DN5066_c0_g1_i3:42-428(+)